MIIGATGMLGHKLVQVLSRRFSVAATARGDKSVLVNRSVWGQAHLIGGVSADDFDSVAQAIVSSQPQAVLNCIGIVKQRAEAKDPLRSIALNALFPHRLAQLCRSAGIRLIHISTDIFHIP